MCDRCVGNGEPLPACERRAEAARDHRDGRADDAMYADTRDDGRDWNYPEAYGRALTREGW